MSVTTGTLWWLPQILECEQLDPAETLILVALAQHINADDCCWLGMDKMARAARVSYATVRRRLASLEERGFLRRSRRRTKNGNLSVYDFVFLRPAFGQPSLRLSGSEGPPALTRESDDQRSPGRAMTSAHQGERTELPRDELIRVEEGQHLLPQLAASTMPSDVEPPARSTTKRQLPADFAITDSMRAWAKANVPTVDIDAGLAHFCDHWVSKGERRADWVATWRNWQRNAVKFSGPAARTDVGPRRVPDPDQDARRRAGPTGRVDPYTGQMLNPDGTGRLNDDGTPLMSVGAT